MNNPSIYSMAIVKSKSGENLRGTCFPPKRLNPIQCCPPKCTFMNGFLDLSSDAGLQNSIGPDKLGFQDFEYDILSSPKPQNQPYYYNNDSIGFGIVDVLKDFNLPNQPIPSKSEKKKRYNKNVPRKNRKAKNCVIHPFLSIDSTEYAVLTLRKIFNKSKLPPISA